MSKPENVKKRSSKSGLILWICAVIGALSGAWSIYKTDFQPFDVGIEIDPEIQIQNYQFHCGDPEGVIRMNFGIIISASIYNHTSKYGFVMPFGAVLTKEHEADRYYLEFSSFRTSNDSGVWRAIYMWPGSDESKMMLFSPNERVSKVMAYYFHSHDMRIELSEGTYNIEFLFRVNSLSANTKRQKIAFRVTKEHSQIYSDHYNRNSSKLFRIAIHGYNDLPSKILTDKEFNDLTR
jgi:hypothetical protein